MRTLCKATLAALALAAAPAASAAPSNWAAPQIRTVTAAKVMGTSPVTFNPQGPLTERALAAAIAAADRLQHPPAPKPKPVVVLSTIPNGAVVAGLVNVQVEVPSQTVQQLTLTLDGAPVQPLLATTSYADGPHTLSLQAVLDGGATYVATWAVTFANAPGAALTALPPGGVPVPITSAPPPAPAAPPRALYTASSPGRAVTIKELDAALVSYLDLQPAARAIQATLQRAGLRPRPGTGTEAVARMLGLRTNHPAEADSLELLPFQAASRAEAAYSLAQVLGLDEWATQWADEAAKAFTLPALGTWQRKILTTAVSYVGYPYIWGGTSPGPEAPFGVRSRGGFDCSGFVWRVYKLTPYAGSGALASMLRGRTTYQMSGEVTGARRIPASRLQPGDVMFFGNGPSSKPSQVDHTGLYLGNGWMIHSSGQGVTLLPFDGWHKRSFAWARRPLNEARLGT